jgi:hypothetical protein
MGFGRYALGVGALLCVFGSFGAGAAALRCYLLPEWEGAQARLAEIVLALALLVITLEVLGSVDLFRLVPIVVASLVVGWGLRAWVGRTLQRDRTREPAASSVDLAGAVGVVLALVVAGVVLAEWAGITLQSFDRGILGADSVAYHLPWAASFAQSGQITSIRYTDFEWLTGFYPATAELFHALGIVLMGTDVLSPGINLVWLALVLLAAWCVGAPRGLGPATLVGGALAMAPPMLFFSTAGSADNDVAGVFFLLAAIALWIGVGTAEESSTRPGPAGAGAARGGRPAHALSAALLPAAAATGLALSVKLNLIPAVAALTVAVIYWAPGEARGRVARTWVATAALTGGFWYLRNLFAVGNPLPYFSFFGLLPTPSPPPSQEHNNYSIVNYLTHPHLLSGFFPTKLADGLGPWWIQILAVAVIGAGLCAAVGPGRLVRLLGLVALVALAGYALTPGSASGPWGHPRGFFLNLRYMAPALAVAFTAAPLATPFAGRRMRWVPLIGLSAIFAATVAQARLWGPGYSLRGQLLTAALFLLAGLVFVNRARLRLPGPIPVRKLLATTAVLLLGVAGVAAGYGGERHYLRDRYRDEQGLSAVSTLWQWAIHLHDQRIAVSGTFGWYFGYPLYGSDDSNRVVYLGDRGRHGSFTTFPSCRAWREALDEGHFQYLVTTARRVMWSGAIRSSPEGSWTTGDPAVRLLFPRRGRAPIQVWKITGRLQPDAC